MPGRDGCVMAFKSLRGVLDLAGQHPLSGDDLEAADRRRGAHREGVDRFETGEGLCQDGFLREPGERDLEVRAAQRDALGG